VTPLYRALTRCDLNALREIAAAADDSALGARGIIGEKPHPATVARLAIPLVTAYRGESGDPQALIRAVEHYARRSGAQVYLDTNDALTLTIPGSREFEQGQVDPVLFGDPMTNHLLDFLNFYPWDLRCLPAVEVMAAWVRP
jgi:hypothetical protein